MDWLRPIITALFVSVVALVPGVTSAAGGVPIVLAVHPYLPFDELNRRFLPLAEHLTSHLGRPVSIRIGRSYDDHQAHVGLNRVDIAYMGPASYVRLVASYGPRILLGRLVSREGSQSRGVIVTRGDSDLSDVTDLRGRRLAFGDPESTMSYLVPRHFLLREGIHLSDLADYAFLGSDANVALAVLAGDFDAGALSEDIFLSYRELGLRDLAWTQSLPEHLFIARDGLDTETIDGLKAAFLGLGEGEEARRIVSSIKESATAVAPAQDADYDAMREILSALEDEGL